jgi:D-alanyl-D-alanine carboxypeptidase
MDTSELQKLAEHTRHQRETGMALLIASLLLGIFLFVPLASRQTNLVAAVSAATSTAPNAYADVAIEAKSAIVYDLVTGQALYAKNADAQLPLASLTKLLTVYAAFTQLSPQETIVIPADALALDLPRAFNVGQSFTLTDIARLTLTASLNDGAAAIAEATALHAHVSETEMLAGAAASLGLSQTFAVNGNGLDVNTAVSGGYGSARDLARLAGALVSQFPAVAEATTQTFAEATSLGGTHYKVANTDPVVSTVAHLLLSKTGFTDLAGGNLALVFDVGIGHPIAVIVLGSSQKARFTDSVSLINLTLSHFANIAQL